MDQRDGRDNTHREQQGFLIILALVFMLLWTLVLSLTQWCHVSSVPLGGPNNKLA